MRAVPGRSRVADPVDEIYAVPLADFVATRNAVAKRLAAAGKADEARAVRGLAKPKATIWALNRIARSQEAAVRAFITAFDALRQAQLRKPDALAPATEKLRDATEQVVHLATDAIAGAGNRAALDVHRRLTTTLRGAAANERERLLRGELTEEITAPGFEVFGAATPSGRRHVRPVPAAPGQGARSPRAAHAAREEERRARSEMLRRRADQLEDQAATREREARRAAAEALEARERLRELEARARTARGTAAKSRRTADSARRRATGRA